MTFFPGFQGHALRARQPGPGSVRTARSCGHPAASPARHLPVCGRGRWQPVVTGAAAWLLSRVTPAAAARHLVRTRPRWGPSTRHRWPGVARRAARPSRAGHPVTEQRSPSRGAPSGRVACSASADPLSSDLPRRTLGTCREGRVRVESSSTSATYSRSNYGLCRMKIATMGRPHTCSKERGVSMGLILLPIFTVRISPTTRLVVCIARL